MKKVTKEMLFRYAFPAAVALLCGALAFGGAVLAGKAELRRGTGEPLPADEPLAGIGRNPAVVRYLAPACAGEAETARTLETYTEWEGIAPDWYHPWEPMAIEWEDNSLSRSGGSSLGEGAVRDAGCPDWNVDSTLYGWDGRTMEAWEMDIFSRVMYLEFWGTSPECCEAGCDAILRLWESGYYGDTMYGVLSAETEVGGPVFETWDAVWGTEYDPDGLWEMRQLCEERFQSGPEWIAPFFRTGHYHEWAMPAYEIDGVYFSIGR
jgi:hypothetical protein